MTDFCRCDNPTVTDGKCDVCQMPPREVPTQLLHKPPPPLAYPPLPPIPPDPPPWRVCPSCGAENTEHMPRCPRANWNVDKCVPPRRRLETDAAYRLRLFEKFSSMNELDQYAVSTVIGAGLDVVGNHLQMPRR